jgi:hypothetical protein
MNNLKRLYPYILLNIFISAATTLAVLWWWDKTQRVDIPIAPTTAPAAALAVNPGDAAGPSATESPAVQPTLPPLTEPVIKIDNVFGAGDAQNEVVLLTRIGEGELQLAGWKLVAGADQSFTFPELSLNKGGAVQVFTRAGKNTVIELYWGLSDPVWQTGKTVTLLDTAGNVRATYTIP